MTKAQGDWVLITENHERMIRKLPKRHYLPERCGKWTIPITNESVIGGISSTLSCREYSEPWNSQYSRLQAVLTNHVKIGPVTGTEVFKSVGTFVKEVQVP